MKTKITSKHHMPELQGLRAIAVTIVVLFHAKVSGFSGGYVGVDVFFVISGFLITGLMLREYERDSQINILNFYARRIKRLLPVAFFVTVISMIVFSKIYAPIETKMATSSAIASVFYLSNVWFASNATDYLGGGNETDPFLHMWSLAVEEQFYLVWPILFIACYKVLKSRTRFFYLFLGVTAISFMLNLLLTKTIQPWAFFGAPFRAWEFGLGAICILLVRRESYDISYFRSFAFGIIGLVLLTVSILRFDQFTSFPGHNALIPVVGIALLLISITAKSKTPVSRILSFGPIQFVGNISYSWYLWHWPAVVFAREFYPEIAEKAMLVSAVVSFGLAVLTTYFLENPIRDLPSSTATVNRIFIGAIIITTLASLSLLSIRHEARVASDSPEQKKYFEAQNDLARIYEDGCHTEYYATKPIICEYGNLDSKKTIVLFGDSHAAHWFGALETLAIEHEYKLVSLTKSACPSFDIEPFDKNLGRLYFECTEWRENAIFEINKFAPIFVVMSNSSSYWDDTRRFGKSIEDDLLASYKATIEKIKTVTVVITDIGSSPFSIPICLARKAGSLGEGDCNFSNDGNQFVRGAEATLDRQIDSLFVIDLNDSVCPSGVCKATEGDKISYIDDNHLSDTKSKALVGVLNKALLGLGLLK